jgi:hypothetical protein
MATAAMHVRGPRLTRHVHTSRYFSTVTSGRYCCWRGRSERETSPSHEGPHAPSCPCHHHLQASGFEGGGLNCVHQPARKTTQPLGTLLWNPPLTTTLTSSAGLHCTLPFPGLKAVELGRAERCGARSGPPDESEPRPGLLRTTCTVAP